MSAYVIVRKFDYILIYELLYWNDKYCADPSTYVYSQFMTQIKFHYVLRAVRCLRAGSSLNCVLSSCSDIVRVDTNRLTTTKC